MENSKSFIEATCLPDARESLQRYVQNHNWALKNYLKIVKDVGAPGFAAIYNKKVIDSDKDNIKLAERLGERFSQEEYESVCIVPVVRPVLQCMNSEV